MSKLNRSFSKKNKGAFGLSDNRWKGVSILYGVPMTEFEEKGTVTSAMELENEEDIAVFDVALTPKTEIE